jgi:hypothetical protein
MTGHNTNSNSNSNTNSNLNSNTYSYTNNNTTITNVTRIYRLSKLWSVALLFFGHVGHITATVTVTANAKANLNAKENANAQNKDASVNTGGFISLKLTPRHVQLERRRRELQQDRERHLFEFGVDIDIDIGVDSTIEERYRRREEAVQVGALFEVSSILHSVPTSESISFYFIFPKTNAN